MKESIALAHDPHGMVGFRGVRVSKFRHVFGAASRKNCYEGLRISLSAHDAQFCAVNPKFLAVVIEVAGGGAFQVIPLKWVRRIDYHQGRVSGHGGPITDLKWNPFNDNVLATASDDCTVKLWHIPEEPDRISLSETLCDLVAHSRRVTYLEWHPTAENVLASAALDHHILLWNVGTGECLVDIDCHSDTIFSMSFNRNGSQLATTCKDKVLRIVDARTGYVLQETWGHDCAKATKVLFLGEYNKLLTTGFSRSSARQVALWDSKDISEPLLLQELDYSSGVLFPFYDADCGMVYLAGKGDGNIRFYEITDCAPYMHFLSEFRSSAPQRGFGVMPKRGLDTSKCEVFRLYKLHTTQSLVEPISFIVPRKTEQFQPDLYPATPGPTPALTADEWICGLEKQPVLVSLTTSLLPSTNKPVNRKGSQVITSDRNNERKFQFLSQVTRPDYRERSLREDYEELMREEHLRSKLTSKQWRRASSMTSGEQPAPAEPNSASSCDGAEQPALSQSETASPAAKQPAAVAERTRSDSHILLATLRDAAAAHVKPMQQRSLTPSCDSELDAEGKPRSHPVGSGTGAQPSQAKPTKPGRIQAHPVVPKTQRSAEAAARPVAGPSTNVVRPFRVTQSSRKAAEGGLPAAAPASADDERLSKLYAAQCQQVRQLLAEADELRGRLAQLEQQLSSRAAEVESLRHEIVWKDQRIDELQSHIYRLMQARSAPLQCSTTTDDDDDL